MILVDCRVWIDYFRGSITRQTEKLDQLLGYEPLAIGDLILTEVLQGLEDERAFNETKKSGYDLLHNDRDFDPFVTYLVLRVVV